MSLRPHSYSSAPSGTEKETAHRLRAGDVGAPCTLGSSAHIDQKQGLYCLFSVAHHNVKKRMMMAHLDRLAPYQGVARNGQP
jgi:hypothetical protein